MHFDSLINRNTTLDWSSIKRNAQILKNKVSGCSCTVDEEFDVLVDQLQFLEKHMHAIVKYTADYSKAIYSIIEGAKETANVLKDLLDPYRSLEESSASGAKVLTKTTESGFQSKYSRWENVDLFLQLMEKIVPSLQQDTDLLATFPKNKVASVYHHVRSISKQTQIRNDRLLDYDRALNKHESLLLRKKQGVLSVKQAQQMYTLERKVAAAKVEYDEINDKIKRELPCFFTLVNSVFDILSVVIYYLQLSIVHQVNTQLQAISSLFDTSFVNSSDFPVYLVQEYTSNTKEVTESLQSLSILDFRDRYLKNLASSVTTFTPKDPIDARYKHCKAIFDFSGEKDGDLSIHAGDIVKVLNSTGLWWEGELNGKTGIFPSNYVEEIKNIS